ncbi:hypothetical protein ACYX8G_18490 [Microbacterium saperdae]
MDLRDQDSTSTDGTTRRTIIRTAAWSVPVVAATIATPLAAASAPAADYAIESNFGSGWYPTTPGNASTGALQFDSDGADKYLRVTGTTAGDVITGVHVNVLISSGWPAPAFTPLPGSNADWSTLADTGTTEVVNGVTYRVYLSSYSPPVIATGTVTNIPIDFYFRSSSPFYPGQTVQTRRFMTVDSTAVSLIRNPSAIVNTNVALADAPHP